MRITLRELRQIIQEAVKAQGPAPAQPELTSDQIDRIRSAAREVGWTVKMPGPGWPSDPWGGRHTVLVVQGPGWGQRIFLAFDASQDQSTGRGWSVEGTIMGKRVTQWFIDSSQAVVEIEAILEDILIGDVR